MFSGLVSNLYDTSKELHDFNRLVQRKRKLYVFFPFHLMESTIYICGAVVDVQYTTFKAEGQVRWGGVKAVCIKFKAMWDVGGDEDGGITKVNP